MNTRDVIRRESAAIFETLLRRLASSADEAEKQVIRTTVEELNGELSRLEQTGLLQAASSIATATAALERAVAAARVGPFDGYLAALEAHLTRLNRLSGKLHASESLDSAIVPPARGGSQKRGPAAARTRGDLEGLTTPAFLTSTQFSDLKQEYETCFERCELRPEFAGNVAYYVKRLRQGQPNYQLVEKEIGVPWVFVGVIHGMECGFNFAGHLHNGDKLTARTVNVPKGYPKVGDPPFTWLQSALDALRLKKLDQVTDWSVPHMLYLLEGYNGFGYRRRGLPTPYLWSFSNIYQKGKFVQDGKFDLQAVSKQCGAALMLKAIRVEEGSAVGLVTDVVAIA
jgi:lysozyme family protein